MTHEGDFALLNPLPILRGEDGQYHCPMPMLQRRYLYDDTDDSVVERVMCGEELRVEWHLSCPVPDHDATKPEARRIEPDEASTWANYSWWELKCVHGHVLMTSANHGCDDEAMPFDTAEVFGLGPESTGGSNGTS